MGGGRSSLQKKNSLGAGLMADLQCVSHDPRNSSGGESYRLPVLDHICCLFRSEQLFAVIH